MIEGDVWAARATPGNRQKTPKFFILAGQEPVINTAKYDYFGQMGLSVASHNGIPM